MQGAPETGNVISLGPSGLPTQWYDMRADLRSAVPPMMSRSGFPVTPGELEALFPRPVIEQELTPQRTRDIPQPVHDAYLRWRPTPMFRAVRLEQELRTPAKLYYKFEGGSPCGSYESVNALPAAFYAKQGRADWIVTGGAGGIWVSAIGHAAAQFGIRAKV